ncbi:MAG: AraC family transcriptional regulator [Rhodospirillales bacterium]
MAASDVDEFRDRLSRLASPHELAVNGATERFAGHLAISPIDHVTLLHVGYGDVSLRIRDDNHQEDSLIVTLLTSGACRTMQRGHEQEAGPDTAFVRDMRYPIVGEVRDYSSFVLHVPLAALRRQARALYGPQGDDLPPLLNFSIDLTRGEGWHFHQTVRFIASQFAGMPDDGLASVIAGIWNDLLLSQLAILVRHHLGDGTARAGQVLPYHLKRACDFMHANAGRKIGLPDICGYAGCSFRTLQLAFRDEYGRTPMAYLRDIRLDHIHRALAVASDGSTVAEIARQGGFSHLGRFAALYRERFGCAPSETLSLR